MKSHYLVNFIYIIFMITHGVSILLAQSNNTNNPDTIETAAEFLDKMATMYATIEDIKADIYMKKDQFEFEGVVFLKPPHYMRINFNNPRGQVINNNGEEFYIYIPSQNVALHQKKRGISSASSGFGESFLTNNGLKLLSKNYLVSYLDKPQFIPLDDTTPLPVLKLSLTWRNTAQNFRSIILSVGKDFLIYKVEAITYNREEVTFIFSNFEINTGIPVARFEYTPPPTAHVLEQFLFDENEEVSSE